MLTAYLKIFARELLRLLVSHSEYRAGIVLVQQRTVRHNVDGTDAVVPRSFLGRQ